MRPERSAAACGDVQLCMPELAVLRSVAVQARSPTLRSQLTEQALLLLLGEHECKSCMATFFDAEVHVTSRGLGLTCNAAQWHEACSKAW